MLYCTNCGAQNNDQTKFCTKCGTPLKKGADPLFADQNNIVIPPPPAPIQHQHNKQQSAAEPAPANKNKILLITGIAVILLGGLFLGWYFLFNEKPLHTKFVLPNDLKLRNSQFDGSDANIITAVSYGSEVAIISEEGEWSNVKVNGQKGFMKTRYLTDAKDFFETDAIVRSVGIRDTINETRFKKSLLNYFRAKNYTWHIQPEINKKYFDNKADSGKLYWRIKEATADNKTIVRGKFNGTAKKGIACIIENESATERKLLVFIYDDNENEMYKEEFSDAGLQNLGIANAKTGSWLVNGNYYTLPYDGIIVTYSNTEQYAIAYFNGANIKLYIQPVEIGD
jgi:hypothetical protein